MYSLSLIVALIPIFFSHILSRFGIFFMEGSSFERVKVYLFLILICAAFIEMVVFSFEEVVAFFQKNYPIVLTLFFLPILFQFIRGGVLDPLFFWGSAEKHHGYFFFAGLIILTSLVSILTQGDHNRLIVISLFSAIIVAGVAILEYLGFSFFCSPNGSGGLVCGTSSSVSWEFGRTIATLGNPNYVAGYLLIHLPLLPRVRQPERSVMLGLLVIALITTGSFAGIAFAVGYGIFLLLRKYEHGISIFMGLVIVLSIFLITLVPHTKFLSLESRGVLMVETMKLATEHPISLLVGAGPDSLIQTFSTQRSDRINAYFPSDMAIDSSHNVIIDFLYSYGILLTFGLGILFFRRFSTLDSTYRHIITLSLLFFSLNVIVIAPIIVTLFALASPPRVPTE